MSKFRNKVVIGLTGGIASGKTTALGFFTELGWVTISTDQIVHDILAENSKVRSMISQRWSTQNIFSRGRIDKKKIAGIIFNSSTEKTWLENILHPLVRKTWVDAILHSRKKNHVVEIPLLFEKKLHAHFNKSVSVFTSVEIQEQRLFARGLPLVDAKRRINSQLSSESKASQSDYVLLGSGSPDFLRAQVNRLHEALDDTKFNS